MSFCGPVRSQRPEAVSARLEGPMSAFSRQPRVCLYSAGTVGNRFCRTPSQGPRLLKPIQPGPCRGGLVCLAPGVSHTSRLRWKRFLSSHLISAQRPRSDVFPKFRPKLVAVATGTAAEGAPRWYSATARFVGCPRGCWQEASRTLKTALPATGGLGYGVIESRTLPFITELAL